MIWLLNIPRKESFLIMLLDPTLDVSVTHVVLSFDYINSGKNIIKVSTNLYENIIE